MQWFTNRGLEVSGAVQEGFKALKLGGGGSVGWRRKSSKWRVFSLSGYLGVVPGQPGNQTRITPR